MQNRVGGTTAGGDAGNGVLNSGFGDDLRRRNVFAEKIEEEFASAFAGRGLGGIRRWNIGEPDWSDTEEFGHQCHGVGGELTTASTGTGASRFLESEKASVIHLAARVGTDGFVNVLDGDRVSLEGARCDRAAVENEAGNIEAGERHNS